MTTTPAAVEALKLAEEAKRLARQVSTAGFNAGVEDAGDAWTRQEKTAIAMNQRVIELDAAIDRLAALAHQPPAPALDEAAERAAYFRWAEHEAPGHVGIHSALTGWLARAKSAPAAVQAKREPLTMQQLNDICRKAHIDFCLDKASSFEMAFARAIERAHGIGAAGEGAEQ